METENIKKGVSVIVYDTNPLYFLIFHRNSNWQGWEFPKEPVSDGETIQQTFKNIVEKIGLKKIEVTNKLEGQRRFKKDNILHVYDVFLAKANMNTPVNLNKKNEKYDTYLWTRGDRVVEKLSWTNEKEVFNNALEILKK